MGHVKCNLQDFHYLIFIMMTEYKRPQSGDYAPFYGKYVELVEEGDLVRILRLAAFETIVLLENLNEKQWMHRYETGKWSIKEVMLHLIDTERIMAYRALRFSRKDTTELAGFDQDAYVPHSEADARSSRSIIEEYQAVRNASVQLFRNLPEPAWEKKGVASKHVVTVRALAYIIAGHEKHHLNIIKTRYL